MSLIANAPYHYEREVLGHAPELPSTAVCAYAALMFYTATFECDGRVSPRQIRGVGVSADHLAPLFDAGLLAAEHDGSIRFTRWDQFSTSLDAGKKMRHDRTTKAPTLPATGSDPMSEPLRDKRREVNRSEGNVSSPSLRSGGTSAAAPATAGPPVGSDPAVPSPRGGVAGSSGGHGVDPKAPATQDTTTTAATDPIAEMKSPVSFRRLNGEVVTRDHG